MHKHHIVFHILVCFLEWSNSYNCNTLCISAKPHWLPFSLPPSNPVQSTPKYWSSRSIRKTLWNAHAKKNDVWLLQDQIDPFKVFQQSQKNWCDIQVYISSPFCHIQCCILVVLSARQRKQWELQGLSEQ